MNQKELFHADVYDALTEDCKAVGMKTIAAMLKPDTDIEAAAKWVSNCLDRKRDQDFDPPHYIIIVNEARKVGSFAYVTFLMRETYFNPPVPKTYDAEAQVVGDKLSTLFEQASGLVGYLEKLRKEVKK